MKKFVLAISFFLVSSFCFSQDQWTLERCINYALENNLSIKQQELYSKMQDNNLKQAKASLYPSLNAGANQNSTFGRSVDPFTNDFSTENVLSTNMSLSSSVTVFSGFQQYYNKKRADADLKTGLLELEQTKNNIILLIASAYLNILYNIDLLEIAEFQLDLSKKQLERTIKLVEAGSLPLQSQYELEAQLSNEELNLVNIQNSLDLALLNLAQILELENTDEFAIKIPDIEQYTEESTLLNVNQIYNEALSLMPEIEASKYRIESSYMSLMMAKGARYPRLSLNASYGTGYSNARKDTEIHLGSPIPSGYFRIDDAGNYIQDVYQFSYDYTYKTRAFDDQIKDNASASLSLGMTIPIFNGLQTKTNISNAQIQYEQSLIQANQAKKDLLKDIQQAHADAIAAFKKFNASQKTVESMQLSFEYTQQRYNLGLLNSVDFNIAKTNLARTESELIRAKYDFIFKQKILDFYRGKQISL